MMTSFLLHLLLVSGLVVPAHQFLSRAIGKKLFVIPSILDSNHVDISPDGMGGVLKRILVKGCNEKGKPYSKDVVEISYKILNPHGELVHESKEEPFTFRLGAEPSEVIAGWEIALKTMYEGEKASFILHPSYAFGENGVPPLVEANATVQCEIELINIEPSALRTFKTVGVDENIKEELIDQIYAGDSPISNEFNKNKPVTETGNRIFFDPAKHKVDPNQRVHGKGRGHEWDESMTAIDITIDLPRAMVKSDISVAVK